ncbi:cob(I)yrinic acid a,c-diamide adenosyltransferase [uncultured Imperialibacter sp.]|uniref:cob(I)yrinic acid a,c-diamide adenosyltransferase n=1 Tax=uncultured Imperialibacter sp. TaxID=1672639 RepID=UPI0030DABF87|tara:strand:- start:24957 stop:25511 length:555 start_codon:yes stop_codon:yes gene_type:complete
MKIYTKTGDKGTTSLLGGTRVSKAHLRIETYGTVDELNSYIGLLRDQEVNKARIPFFIEIQEQLFTIGSHLAMEPGSTKFPVPQVDETLTSRLEAAMDEMDALLPPMKNFILPGGHPSVSHGHIARCVCRRAERLVIGLQEQEAVEESIVQFLNRLSDYLFVLCRMMAQELGVEETPWKPRSPK